jgi:hypothetical protein
MRLSDAKQFEIISPSFMLWQGGKTPRTMVMYQFISACGKLVSFHRNGQG